MGDELAPSFVSVSFLASVQELSFVCLAEVHVLVGELFHKS